MAILSAFVKHNSTTGLEPKSTASFDVISPESSSHVQDNKSVDNTPCTAEPAVVENQTHFSNRRMVIRIPIIQMAMKSRGVKKTDDDDEINCDADIIGSNNDNHDYGFDDSNDDNGDGDDYNQSNSGWYDHMWKALDLPSSSSSLMRNEPQEVGNNRNESVERLEKENTPSIELSKDVKEKITDLQLRQNILSNMLDFLLDEMNNVITNPVDGRYAAIMHVMIGHIYDCQGDYEKALEFYGKGVLVHPKKVMKCITKKYLCLMTDARVNQRLFDVSGFLRWAHGFNTYIGLQAYRLVSEIMHQSLSLKHSDLSKDFSSDAPQQTSQNY